MVLKGDKCVTYTAKEFGNIHLMRKEICSGKIGHTIPLLFENKQDILKIGSLRSSFESLSSSTSKKIPRRRLAGCLLAKGDPPCDQENDDEI